MYDSRPPRCALKIAVVSEWRRRSLFKYQNFNPATSGNCEILQAARLPLTSTYIQNSLCCPQLLRLMPDWDGYGSGPRMLPGTPPAAVGGGFPTSSDNFCVASSHQLHALPNWAIGRHQWAHAFLSHRPKNLEWVQMDHSPIPQRKAINLWWLDYKLIRA